MTIDAKPYSDLSSEYEYLGSKLEDTIRELLRNENIGFHNVTHRVKSQKSAAKKIQKDGTRYKTYSDLHDFLGIRITTYFVSQVDRVAELLEREFEVDWTRSSDKRATTDPDRFGYVSLHYVIQLGATRRDLGEWAQFKDMFVEVQIRTILQHAWAEIEHDLGYKAPDAIPDSIKRRFSRLAGLLELADDEFETLRDASEEHARRVDDAVREDHTVPLDQDSAMALVSTNAIVMQADRAIAAGYVAQLAEPESYYAARCAVVLASTGLSTTAEVTGEIEQNLDSLVGFAIAWLSDAATNEVSIAHDPDMDEGGHFRRLRPGISLFYLYLHRVIALQGPEGLRETSLGGMDNPSFVDRLVAFHDQWF